jgi:hypothetical protein
VHHARLPAHLSQLDRIDDPFGAIIPVAQTARCEPYSGLGARLKHTQPPDPQRQERRPPPRPRHARHQK